MCAARGLSANAACKSSVFRVQGRSQPSLSPICQVVQLRLRAPQWLACSAECGLGESMRDCARGAQRCRCSAAAHLEVRARFVERIHGVLFEVQVAQDRHVHELALLTGYDGWECGGMQLRLQLPCCRTWPPPPPPAAPDSWSATAACRVTTRCRVHNRSGHECPRCHGQMSRSLHPVNVQPLV